MGRARITYGRVDLTRLRTSVKNFQKSYYDAMQELMREAAGAFVNATVERVHVDTGMSAASLEPLAQSIGQSILSSVEVRVRNESRNWGTTLSGTSYRNKIRDISAGLKAGEKAYKLTFGSIKRPWMVFEFTIHVFQYAFHEPSWASLDVGLAAFIDYIDANYDRFLPEGLNAALNAYSTVGDRRG